MKYFFDTEFIKDGTTIDLISIAIVCEDGRSMYLQNRDCKFTNASDWVWRNVFPSLSEFNMSGRPACSAKSLSGFDYKSTGKCWSDNCPWRNRYEIKDAVLEFCSVEKYGNPEFWGYYADYDWVVFCQLFGTMMQLPKGFPMYCRDVKKLCDELGNPPLPEQGKGEHNALSDALWNKAAYDFWLV